MNKSFGIIAVTAAAFLLLTATGMTHGVFAHSSHHHHHSHHHNHHHHHSHGSSNNSQSLSQANNCGNGFGDSHVKCQNVGSQIQGSGNAVNVIGNQG
jgi:hypothetical protein